MSESYHWQYLIDKYLAGSCSREEMEELLRKVAEQTDLVPDENPGPLDDVLKAYWELLAAKGKAFENPGREARWDMQFRRMLEEAGRTAQPEAAGAAAPVAGRRIPRRWGYWAAAACLLLLAGAGYLLFSSKNIKEQAPVEAQAIPYKNVILPGSNGAVLTLADGRKIVLDSAGNGTLAVQGGTKLINRNGRVIYERGTNVAPEMQVSFNNLSTPKGKQYQLLLPDGSRVWLNAASSIRYPTAFTGNSRTVEVQGEAYFEIAPDAGRVFSVRVNGTEISVLGTRFNVRAYEDETMTKTTLLAGAVRVSGGGMERILRPEQQAQVGRDGKMLLLEHVDSASVVGWRDGYFAFNSTDLVSVMQDISRWYDVEVVYEGPVPDRKFGGEISRRSDLSQVLRVLEMSKVGFRIEGRKIIVRP